MYIHTYTVHIHLNTPQGKYCVVLVTAGLNTPEGYQYDFHWSTLPLRGYPIFKEVYFSLFVLFSCFLFVCFLHFEEVR